MRSTILVLLLAALTAVLAAHQPVAKFRPLPSLREADAIENRWVEKRYARVHEILKEQGYDAWLLSMREYAEDTAFRSLVSTTTTFSARRRTLFLFHTDDSLPSPLHLIDNKPGIWADLAERLEKVDPEKIAVNIDQDMAFSDGLHSGEGQLLLSKLPTKYRERVSSHRPIGVEVIAARVGGEEQLGYYHMMQENIWWMIQEVFSERVIEIGKTTKTDLEWWTRDTMRWKLGLSTWFHTDVDVYRHPGEPSVEDHPALRPGDMLHIDIGITFMGMNTDTQHLGYILRPNETHVPKDLLKGLHDANKMQDFNRKQMVPGRTGDEVFFAIANDTREAGLKGFIYSHPIGDYGHSAGAIIGMANWQDSIPGGGQNKVLKNYWTSVELQGHTDVPEWGREQRFELEEDVYWDGKSETFEFVFGQQTEFHLCRPKYKKHLLEVGGVVPWLAGALGLQVQRWV